MYIFYILNAVILVFIYHTTINSILSKNTIAAGTFLIFYYFFLSSLIFSGAFWRSLLSSSGASATPQDCLT